eukprot:TRINITY_DN3720_c0_g1_i4.p3 TRINITY_DN3720_c0_g1~~TRINITY_DN3720_c0_g1_i4.p3  ORF type:complete len:152 (-),score=28.40 TRINITY_DN3720_c0_g1_i4:235-690(-)
MEDLDFDDLANTEARQQLQGNWQGYKVENFDEYLAKTGLNFVVRKAVQLLNLWVGIEIGQEISVRFCIGPVDLTHSGPAGVAFRGQDPDGNDSNITFSWDGDTLIRTIEPDDGIGSVARFSIDGDGELHAHEELLNGEDPKPSHVWHCKKE